MTRTRVIIAGGSVYLGGSLGRRLAAATLDLTILSRDCWPRRLLDERSEFPALDGALADLCS